MTVDFQLKTFLILYTFLKNSTTGIAITFKGQYVDSIEASIDQSHENWTPNLPWVVYMCSSLLQLAPGSRDLSQAEKRMSVMSIYANSQTDN